MINKSRVQLPDRPKDSQCQRTAEHASQRSLRPSQKHASHVEVISNMEDTIA